jgi:SMC interacting uncharacterized protein involved in chromosome segregation
MALTKNDMKALLEAQKQALVQEMDTRFTAQTTQINRQFTAQNQQMTRSFEDVKEVMQKTYVSRDEFEEKYTELQTEVDDLQKRLHALERSMAATS